MDKQKRGTSRLTGVRAHKVPYSATTSMLLLLLLLLLYHPHSLRVWCILRQSVPPASLIWCSPPSPCASVRLMLVRRLRAANLRDDTNSELLDANGVSTNPTKKAGTPEALAGG